MSFPRQRPPLPEAYQKIYTSEYCANRTGGTFLARAVLMVEGWMHWVIARDGNNKDAILEIGAGTLNHLPYETSRRYDVVEPFDPLYDSGFMKEKVSSRYRDIAEIPAGQVYDRIFSVAVLEHVEDLPALIARSGLHLATDGFCQHCIPSEGGFLWGLSWRLTTGLAYRLRTGLSYGVLARYQHINRADEILSVLRWFFAEIDVKRFPLPGLHLSLYTYIRARAPYVERCRAYLEEPGS
jgi:hypothetical protein